MFKTNDITSIKSNVSDSIGQKVRLTSKRGRKKAIVRMGVLEAAYPSIFTVKLTSDESASISERVVSYSYADVLTRAVEICLDSDAVNGAVETA